MSDTGTKLKNITIYLIPSFIGSIIPLLSLPIITRFLTPTDFGAAAMAMSTTALMISFLTCGVDTATQRYYFEYRKDEKALSSLINTGVVFLITVILVSLPAVYIFSGAISKIVMGSGSFSNAIFAAYVNGCLALLVNYYLILFRNMEKASRYSFFTVTHNTISTVLTLSLVVWFGYGYMGIIYGSLFASAAVFVTLFILFLKDHPFCFEKSMLFDNLRFGIPLLPNLFTSSIYQFFDKYMLSNMASLSSVGVLSIAQNISNKVFIFMGAIQSTFDPIFMKDMFDRGSEGAVSVGRNFTIFTYLSVTAVLFSVLFGEEIIYVIAPPSYYEAINVMLILLCGIAVQTFGKIVGSQLAYIKKAYLSFPITVMGLAVNVVLNLGLIPRWQTAGAACATVITIIVMNSIYVYVAQRGYRIIYDAKALALIYTNLLTATVIQLYMRSMEIPFFVKYGVKISILLSYIAIGMAIGIVTREKWMAIREMVFPQRMKRNN